MGTNPNHNHYARFGRGCCRDGLYHHQILNHQWCMLVSYRCQYLWLGGCMGEGMNWLSYPQGSGVILFRGVLICVTVGGQSRVKLSTRCLGYITLEHTPSLLNIIIMCECNITMSPVESTSSWCGSCWGWVRMCRLQ